MKSVLWPDKFPVMQTERLLLRQVAPEDSAGLSSVTQTLKL